MSNMEGHGLDSPVPSLSLIIDFVHPIGEPQETLVTIKQCRNHGHRKNDY